MLVFCDESWKENGDGKKVGTLSAVAIPAHAYNAIDDCVFHLKEKYFGLENARAREAKGEQLLSHYEYKRESAGEVSISSRSPASCSRRCASSSSSPSRASSSRRRRSISSARTRRSSIVRTST